MPRYGIYSPKQIKRTGVSVYRDENNVEQRVTKVGNFPEGTPKKAFEVLARGLDDAVLIEVPLVEYLRRDTRKKVRKSSDTKIL